VLASDGFDTTSLDSPTLSVPTKPADVMITAPADDAELPAEETVILRGSAHDPEDGLLPDEAFSWWSDRDGLLGLGASVMLPALTLSPGWHRVTLQAADSDAQLGSNSVTVFVREPPAACIGDCSADGQVTVDELVKGVNIALGTALLSDCAAFDKNGDQRVMVDELVTAVNNALSGCP
jgi:hypothetical protein